MESSLYDNIVKVSNQRSQQLEEALKKVDTTLINFLELRIQQEIWDMRKCRYLGMSCWAEITKNVVKHLEKLPLEINRYGENSPKFHIRWDNNEELIEAMTNKIDYNKNVYDQVDKVAISLLQARLELSAIDGNNCCYISLWDDVSRKVRDWPVTMGFDVKQISNIDTTTAIISWENKPVSINNWYATNYHLKFLENGRKVTAYK